jgi:hypothetical protein
MTGCHNCGDDPCSCRPDRCVICGDDNVAWRDVLCEDCVGTYDVLERVARTNRRDRAMNLHESITAERVCELVEESMMDCTNPGICAACGEEADGCEPDARGYKCEACGAPSVYGAEELLMYVA